MTIRTHLLTLDTILDKHQLGTLLPEDYEPAIDVLVNEYTDLQAEYERLDRAAEWHARLDPRVTTALTDALLGLVKLIPADREQEAVEIVARCKGIVHSVTGVLGRVEGDDQDDDQGGDTPPNVGSPKKPPLPGWAVEPPRVLDSRW